MNWNRTNEYTFGMLFSPLNYLPKSTQKIFQITNFKTKKAGLLKNNPTI